MLSRSWVKKATAELDLPVLSYGQVQLILLLIGETHTLPPCEQCHTSFFLLSLKNDVTAVVHKSSSCIHLFIAAIEDDDFLWY